LNTWRCNWDLLIIVLVLYNAFTLPLEIAFNPPFLSSEVAKYVNLFLDLFFLIDIFVNFRTTYVDNFSGEEVTNGKKIAMNYLCGRFCIDLVSMIPFDSFTNNMHVVAGFNDADDMNHDHLRTI
jgi:hypothetical protein